MYRTFIFSISAIFSLSACSSAPVKESSPTTAAPATQQSTPVSVVQATIGPGWLSQLEAIGPKNWKRLQLLRTFPAEMPMDHSAVTIAPDGKNLVVGSSTSAQLLFLDIESGKLSGAMHINGVQNADSPFKTIEYLANGTIMASSDRPYAIYNIDNAGNILTTWYGIDFAVSADDKTMAFGVNEGTPLVDIASAETVNFLNEIDGMGYSFSPDNSKIAIDVVTVEDLSVEIWDIAGQTLMITLPNTGNARFSPNGKFLAVTDYEDSATPLKIFSPDGAVQITTLQISDSNSLTGIEPVFSPDGLVVASQMTNGYPTAWNTTNWEMLEAPALQGYLDSFSPDGRILITRAPDGGILIWGVLP